MECEAASSAAVNIFDLVRSREMLFALRVIAIIAEYDGPIKGSVFHGFFVPAGLCLNEYHGTIFRQFEFLCVADRPVHDENQPNLWSATSCAGSIHFKCSIGKTFFHGGDIGWRQRMSESEIAAIFGHEQRIVDRQWSVTGIVFGADNCDRSVLCCNVQEWWKAERNNRKEDRRDDRASRHGTQHVRIAEKYDRRTAGSATGDPALTVRHTKRTGPRSQHYGRNDSPYDS